MTPEIPTFFESLKNSKPAFKLYRSEGLAGYLKRF